MKLLRLDLIAFGPFTGVSLDLSKGSDGLHLIYGPNEAGKSSALRALGQLFFGIPSQTADDFIHPYKDMRIGACIRDGQGELEFIRRKATTKSLRGPEDEAVIEEATLRRYLGGIDEDIFQTMFGINNATLVEGGKAIVEGGGDIGEVLFAAGAGLAHLRSIQQVLDKEASELFLPKGAKKSINQALNELDDLRRTVKECTLPSSEWVAHEEALNAAQAKKHETIKQLDDQHRNLNRLERISKALPSIARRKELLAELERYADAMLLPADFAEKRRETEYKLAMAEKVQTETERGIAELNRQIEELPVADNLLEQAEAIERLHRRLGSHEKAMTDRAGLATTHQQLEAHARTILRELGRNLELSEAESLRLTAPQRCRIQDLGNERQGLAIACEEALARIDDINGRIEDVNRQLGLLPACRDAAELQKCIRHVQQQGNLDKELQDVRLDLRGIESQAEIDLKRLPLWSGTLDQIARLAVPAFETIDRFETELAALEGDRHSLQGKVAELETRILDLGREMQHMELRQKVPSEADLIEARQNRDAGWRRVRQAWQQATAVPGESIEAFEASIDASDELADRLRREADQVAAKARCLADRQRCEQELAKRAAEVARIEAQLESSRHQWSDLWEPLGIDPHSPREMRAWVRHSEALSSQARDLQKQRERLTEVERQIDMSRRELTQRLLSLGEPAAGMNERLSALLDRCLDVVEQIETVTNRRRDLEKELDTLGKDQRQARAAAGDAEQKLRRWQTDWSQAMLSLGLGGDASPSQANAVLERLHELFDKLGQAESQRQRLDGIDRDSRQFSMDVRALAERLTPALAGSPAEQAAVELHARLTRVRAAMGKLEALRRQRETASAQLAEALATISECRARLALMCREARCANIGQLTDAEQRSTRRRELEMEIQRLEKTLLELSGGATLADFLADAQTIEPDSVSEQVSRIQAQIKDLDQQKSTLDQIIGSERDSLKKMDGSAKAAAAEEQKHFLIARIGSDAERYARLRLASAILREAIERYREKNQGPVLKRASELFADLTVGSFEGLRVDVNDDGQPVLVGVRPGKKTVPVHEGMSDGTRDQLYLALRLASLETYFDKHDPVPFIVDDILINFDDDRASAALKALAQLSERTQVLFFTHHQHLVELATATLDEDVVFVHELGGKTPAVVRTGS